MVMILVLLVMAILGYRLWKGFRDANARRVSDAKMERELRELNDEAATTPGQGGRRKRFVAAPGSE